MNTLAIYLPTYKRPEVLQKVADNVESTTKNSFTLYFGVEKEDKASYQAALKTGHKVVINDYDPKFGYSNTIQTCYEKSKEPYFFHANDDFTFLPNWDEPYIQFLETNPHIMVCGAHDGMPGVSYSTIHFIRRKYIEEQSGVIDMPNRVFYPYYHNYQDTEFTQTAQKRGVYGKIEVPCIVHNHPNPDGKDDTYKKNDATSGLDGNTFNIRKHLWEDL